MGCSTPLCEYESRIRHNSSRNRLSLFTTYLIPTVGSRSRQQKCRFTSVCISHVKTVTLSPKKVHLNRASEPTSQASASSHAPQRDLKPPFAEETVQFQLFSQSQVLNHYTPSSFLCCATVNPPLNHPTLPKQTNHIPDFIMSIKNGQIPLSIVGTSYLTFYSCIPLFRGIRCDKCCSFRLRCRTRRCHQARQCRLCFHIKEQGWRDRELAH